jgi:vacuolar-type H+-ATPase subunit E/Vma4
MPLAALIDAIRRRTDEEVDALWQKARSDADTCRTDAARAIAECRARCGDAAAAAATDAARAATAKADREARQIRAAMKAALGARLHTLATLALPQLRGTAYPQLFAALARELPAATWRRVVVNPLDQDLARRLFPQAEVVSDPTIVGGLDVEGSGVRISNTIETRLEQAWPELLASMLSEVLEEASHS